MYSTISKPINYKNFVDTKFSKNQSILEYILAQADDDERPYIKVRIYGKEFFGLLDSGANKTFIGGLGWELLQNLGVTLIKNSESTCTVANDSQC